MSDLLTKHIIRRQLVELQIENTSNATRVQYQVSQLMNGEIKGIIEGILDDLLASNQYLYFDHLEIDLGIIEEKDLKSVIPERLKAQLETSLKLSMEEPYSPQKKSNARTVSTEDAQQNAILYFIEEGCWPWWYPVNDFESFEDKCRELLHSKPEVINAVLSLVKASETYRWRLVYQFSESVLFKLDTNGKLPDLLQLIPALSEIVDLSAEEIRYRLFECYFEKRTVSPVEDLKKIYIKILLKVFRRFVKEEKLHLSPIQLQRVLQSTSIERERHQQINLSYWQDLWTSPVPWREIFAEMFTAYFAGKAKSSSANGNSDSNSEEDQIRISKTAERDPLEKNSTPKETQVENYSSPEPEGDEPSPSSRPYDEISNDRKLQSGSADRVFYSREDSTLKHQLKEEGIILPHAGLVILHPFLPQLLANLEWLEENKFKDEISTVRAIHFLAWLATGEEAQAEPDLLLPKLLCGWDLERSLPREITFSEAEKEVGWELLRAVIKHWEVLKNTSPEGLQQAFLQRDGKLSSSEAGYSLIIESKAQDILLKQLPWGISIVMYPWTRQLLFVDW